MRELELYFGPQHPGMVGNFSITLKVEGDRILEAIPNPGYLHRGFEKLMELRNWVQNFPFVCRINVIEPDSMEAVYAMAVEKLANIQIPERAKYIRTIVLELGRLASHLFGAWAYANMLGFDTPAQWAMADRDHILDLFEELTGGRVYHIYILPGGVRRDLPDGFEEKVMHFLHALASKLPDYNETFFENRIFYERAKDIGKIKKEEAIEWAATGQVLRATGIKHDIRKIEPYFAYDKVEFDIPTRADGDAYSRILVIRDEMLESAKIIMQCLEKMQKQRPCLRFLRMLKFMKEKFMRCLVLFSTEIQN